MSINRLYKMAALSGLMLILAAGPTAFAQTSTTTTQINTTSVYTQSSTTTTTVYKVINIYDIKLRKKVAIDKTYR